MIGVDQLGLVRVPGFQQPRTLGKTTSGVLPAVLFMRADGCEKLFHRRVVAGEKLAVEMSGIPFDQQAAEIENHTMFR
jgi:hypothetical protein